MNNRMRRAGAAWACVLLLLAAGCTAPMPWERDWGRSTSLSSFFGQGRFHVGRKRVQRRRRPVRPDRGARRRGCGQSGLRRGAIRHQGVQVRGRKGLVRVGCQAEGHPGQRSRQVVQSAGAADAGAVRASRPIVGEPGRHRARPAAVRESLAVGPSRRERPDRVRPFPGPAGQRGRGPAAVPASPSPGPHEHHGLERSRLVPRPAGRPRRLAGRLAASGPPGSPQRPLPQQSGGDVDRVPPRGGGDRRAAEPSTRKRRPCSTPPICCRRRTRRNRRPRCWNNPCGSIPRWWRPKTCYRRSAVPPRRSLRRTFRPLARPASGRAGVEYRLSQPRPGVGVHPVPRRPAGTARVQPLAAQTSAAE